ncbi:MAG: ComF family protein [Actinobacteria bacterium]|nr:MAG: ComF family protein [Actinomycetota bacterium]
MLDLLLPQRCLGCSRNGPQVCAACAVGLRRLRAPMCARCGRPTAWPVARCSECGGRRLAFAVARAAVAYDDPVRRIVAAWKERGLRRLAPWAAGIVVDVVARPEAGVLTFVPPDRDRRLKRGHHAAEGLARELAREWGLPAEPLLARTRPSRRQRGLDQGARRRNVRGAFAASGRVPPSVVLVDDVYTTGATANAAASALRRAGARRVEVVTFARAIRFR